MTDENNTNDNIREISTGALDAVYTPIDKKRHIAYLRDKRKARQTQVFFERLRFLLKIIAICALGFLLFKLVKYPTWYMPKYSFDSYPNTHLRFEGNVLTPDLAILNALRRVKIPDKAIYRIDTDEFVHEIEKISSIKKAYIRRCAFPAGLMVIVEEKTPIISIAPNEEVLPLVVFANDGTIIAREFVQNKSLNTFKVLCFDNYLNWNEKQVDSLYLLGKTAEDYSKEKVEYIDLRNQNDVRIKLDSVNIRLGMLDRNAIRRLHKISAILPQASTLSDPIDYIDLRWDDSAYIKLKK